MKLEFKHLVGYLPHGIPAILSRKGIFNQDDEYPNPRTLELGVIKNISFWYPEITGQLHISETYSFDFDEIDEIEVVLHPLSDLTKEIEVNGEKFVPILELYKMRTQHMTDKIDKYYIENDTAVLKLGELTTPKGDLSFIHYFEIDIDIEAVNFSICTETIDIIKNEVINESFGFIGNEFNMLQKLYEWHFDIYGLIQAGLAIDINTLKSSLCTE